MPSDSKVQGRHKQAGMAETGDNLIDNSQPRNSGSLADRGTEDNCIGGAGGTTANHIAETSDSRKRPGASSPVKVSAVEFTIYIHIQSVDAITTWAARTRTKLCINGYNAMVGIEIASTGRKACKTRRHGLPKDGRGDA